MVRKKGAKNKTIEQRAEGVMNEASKLYAKAADPKQKQELAEAVKEISEVISSGEELLRAPPEVKKNPKEIVPRGTKQKKFAGFSTIDGTEVWI